MLELLDDQFSRDIWSVIRESLVGHERVIDDDEPPVRLQASFDASYKRLPLSLRHGGVNNMIKRTHESNVDVHGRVEIHIADFGLHDNDVADAVVLDEARKVIDMAGVVLDGINPAGVADEFGELERVISRTRSDVRDDVALFYAEGFENA